MAVGWGGAGRIEGIEGVGKSAEVSGVRLGRRAPGVDLLIEISRLISIEAAKALKKRHAE
jgi:hypothetical protein